MVAEVFDFSPARIYEICGLRSAVYVCLECGRFVCPNCQSGPMCKDCQSRSAAGPRSTTGARTFPLLPTLAVMAVLVGVGFVILGSLTGSSSTGSSSTCSLADSAHYRLRFQFILRPGFGVSRTGLCRADDYFRIISEHFSMAPERWRARCLG